MLKLFYQFLTKLGVGDNVVYVTRHANFYRAFLRWFNSPYTWFSIPSGFSF